MADYVESGTFPQELVKEMAKLSINGADIPKEDGGLGLSNLDTGYLMYELARIDASVGTFFLLHCSAGIRCIYLNADPALKKKLLAETIPIKKVIANAITEPNSGSDVTSIQTKARKVEGGYRITGRKIWTGNGTFADYILVFARNMADKGSP